jgi:hypothetical protein
MECKPYFNLLAQLPGADSQETIPATPRTLEQSMKQVRTMLEKEAAARSKPVATPARGDTVPVEPEEPTKEWEGSHYWQGYQNRDDGYGSYGYDQYD